MKNAIVMLTHNRRGYTEKTLRNYERQIGGSGGYDVFVYDNGSSDGTAEFLRSYRGPLRLTVHCGDRNIGIAEATKFLLTGMCFGKGYDFIIKVDDDEFLPDGWPDIMGYWDEIEKNDAPFIGFKRKEISEYFEGLKWVSCRPENVTPIRLGRFECYRSIASPGCQISTEEWWMRVLPDLTDLGLFYGGWDPTFMAALVKQRKYFLVVYNYESDHFQRDEDHPEFSEFKKKQFEEFKERHEAIWKRTRNDFERAMDQLEELKRKRPDDPVVRELIRKAEEIRNKLKQKSL